MAALLAWGAAAQAQWVDFAFNPTGGSYGVGQQIAVTIEFCGQDDAWFDAPGGAYFNDQWANFNSYLGSDPNCTDYSVATGTIILEPGVNVLRAEIAGNGYWYEEQFYIAPSYEPALVDLTPHNGQYRSVGLCAVSCFDATAAYSLPPYVSMDVPRATALVYSSATVTGRHTVIADIRNTSTVSPNYFSLKLQKAGIPGFVTLTNGTSEMYVTNLGNLQRVAVQFDDPTLPTGAHYYTLIVRSHWGGVVEETLAPLRVLVVNERASPYGAGWTVAGVQRLHRQTDNTIVITEGGGSAVFFAQGCGSWCAPPGDFTTLTEDLGSSTARYRRQYPDGAVVSFDVNGLMRKVVDRFDQHPTELTYQSLSTGPWVLQSISDPADLVTTFGYTVSALASIQDPGGRTATFLIDGAGDLRRITDVDGVRADSAIYSNHRLVDLIDRAGGTWSFGYDYAYKIATVTSPYVIADDVSQRLVTQFKSPDRELLVDPGSSVGTTPGNLAPWRLTEFRGRVTAPAGEVTEVIVDRFRAVLTELPPTGDGYSFQRNQHSQVTSSSASATGTIQYTWVGVQLREVHNQRTGEHVYFEYEPFYNLLKRQYGNGPEVRYFYDLLGEPDSMSVGGGTATRFETDPGYKGRILRVVDPEVDSTTYRWFGNTFRNTDTVVAGTRTTTHTYDTHGRRVSTKLPDGVIDSAAYDIVNRDTLIVGPHGHRIRKRFGSVFLDTLIDGKGQVYRWQYNALGWTTTEFDPLGQDQTYAYDRRGNPIRWVNRRDYTTTFAYDSVGRLKTRTLADGRVTTYSYRPPFSAWDVVTASNGESSDTLRVYGDTTYEITVRNGTAYVLKSVRNHAAQSLALTSPSGVHAPITYQGNAQGGLGSLTLGGAVTYTTNFNYNADGQLTNASVGEHFVPGPGIVPTTVVGRGYRSTHALAMQTFANGTQQIFFGTDHAQDTRGRLVERLDGDRNRRETFQYDSLGRLGDYKQYSVSPPCPPTDPAHEFGVPCTGGSHSLQEQRSFTYDAVGNIRTSAQDSIEPGNRLRRAKGYWFDYDPDGNLTRKHWIANAWEFDQYLWWNSIGELDSVWTTRQGVTQRVRFGYDGFGRRVRTNVDGQVTRYLHRGDQIAAEVDGGGTVIRKYSYYPGTDRPHSVETASGLFFYVTDGQGNVTGHIRADGLIADTLRYSPHGEIVSGGPTVALDRYRFAAREYDSEMSLYFNRARYYDPQIGRFISEDPIGLAGGVNPYAYAANDPVNYRDPGGLRKYCVYWYHYNWDKDDNLYLDYIEKGECWEDEGGGTGGVLDGSSQAQNSIVMCKWPPSDPKCWMIYKAIDALQKVAGPCGDLGRQAAQRYAAGRYGYDTERRQGAWLPTPAEIRTRNPALGMVRLGLEPWNMKWSISNPRRPDDGPFQVLQTVAVEEAHAAGYYGPHSSRPPDLLSPSRGDGHAEGRKCRLIYSGGR